jgi:hypothetical protein
MADALYGVSQLTVRCDEPVEIVLADFQQIGVLDGADRGGARTSTEQRHLSKGVPHAKRGNGAAGGLGARYAVCQHLHFSERDNVEGITGFSGLEQNFTRLQVAGVDARQDLLDLFGRQMAHQIAGRQQLDSLARIRLFACQGIFAELGDVAYRRSLLFQE